MRKIFVQKMPMVRQRPGMAGFIPWVSLSNVIYAFEADYIAGLSDNEPVATWSDLSGNDNDAEQSTAGWRPLYKLVSDSPVVRFDGSDDRLVIGRGIPDSYTIIFVFARLGTGRGVFETVTSGTGSTTPKCLFNYSSTTLRHYSGGNYQNLDTMNQDEFYIVTVTNTGSVRNAWMNGGQVMTNQSAGTAGTNTLTNIGVGFGGFTNCDFKSVLLCEGVLSAADRQLAEQFYATRHGITLV